MVSGKESKREKRTKLIKNEKSRPLKEEVCFPFFTGNKKGGRCLDPLIECATSDRAGEKMVRS